MGLPDHNGRMVIHALVAAPLQGSKSIFTCVMRSVQLIAVLLALSWVSGCSEYNENGELVRHHLGYVKIVSPAVAASDIDMAVRILEIEAYGVWVIAHQKDSRQSEKTGAGFGYMFDRRELIPKDCRMIVRLTTTKQIETFLRRIRELNLPKGGICAIRD